MAVSGPRFSSDELVVPGDPFASGVGHGEEIAAENAARRDERTKAWLAADFWEKVGREVAGVGTWSPDAVREAYRATVARPVSAAAYPELGDPSLVALELVGRWRGVIGDRDAERRVALAEMDAQRAALEAEVESRPKLSPRPLRARVADWNGTLLGRIVRRGDTIDLGQCHIKRGKVAALRSQGILEPHPLYPTELDVAQSLNGEAVSVLRHGVTPPPPVVTDIAGDVVTVVFATPPGVEAVTDDAPVADGDGVAAALADLVDRVTDDVPVTLPDEVHHAIVAKVAAKTVTKSAPLSSAERARRYRARKAAEAAASRDDSVEVMVAARRKIEHDPDMSWRDAMDEARREIASTKGDM